MDDLGLAEPAAPAEPVRRPRFEMREAARSRQSSRQSGLGLTKVQGAVEGIKVYAATHAVKEEGMKHGASLVEVLQSSEREKARRDFVDATRNKVLTAAQNHFSAKKVKQAPQAAPAAASAQQSDGKDVSVVIDELSAQRRALAKTGFDDQARAMHTEVVKLRAKREKERADTEQRLYRQRLWALELSHKQQRERFLKQQDAATRQMETQWKSETAALTAAQAAEYQQCVELVTKAAALEDVELPRRLVKYRYRASNQLVALRNTVDELKVSGGLGEMCEELRARESARHARASRRLRPARASRPKRVPFLPRVRATCAHHPPPAAHRPPPAARRRALRRRVARGGGGGRVAQQLPARGARLRVVLIHLSAPRRAAGARRPAAAPPPPPSHTPLPPHARPPTPLHAAPTPHAPPPRRTALRPPPGRVGQGDGPAQEDETFVRQVEGGRPQGARGGLPRLALEAAQPVQEDGADDEGEDLE